MWGGFRRNNNIGVWQLVVDTVTTDRSGCEQEIRCKKTRKRLMLIYPGKTVKKRFGRAENSNDDRGSLFLTKSRVTLAEAGKATYLA